MNSREATTTCVVCSSPMAVLKPWFCRCPSCRFEASTLEAGAGTGIQGLEQLRRDNFEILLDRLEALGPLQGRRLLEIGSARGWFLEAAHRRGADVRGIEPDAANAEIAQARGFATEIGLFPAGLNDRGPYNVIVFNDVLEHIPDPARALRDVEPVLRPGGLAVVNLPSSRGTLYRVSRLLDACGLRGPFERLWQKGFPSPHVSYFDPPNLCRLVEGRTGLVQVATATLPSVVRTGLWPRIGSSQAGLVGGIMFACLWPLSFVLGWLPADIHVAIFRKPAGEAQ